MFERILIVCTGNICRSPMAEVLLRQQLGLAGHDAMIQSAGTDALIGSPADEPACSLMRCRALDMSAHRAIQVNQDLTRWAELILVMQAHHRDSVLALDPTARGKTFLLGHWSGEEIPDPYERGDEVYARVLQMIERAVEAWTRKILPAP